MQTKHTPGPWVVSTAWADENERIIIKNDGEIIKVGTEEGVAVCLAGRVNNPEAQLNARLIAAAPDLFEALIQLKSWVSKIQDWSGVGDPPCEIVDQAIKKATI